jgi:cyclopropane fatty-acyl-phospholipid synthase-like methyltransferase
MLDLLRQGCAGSVDRLQVRLGDARDFAPAERVDLVVTHFFLDCLTQSEVDELVKRVAARLEGGGRWVVSEFRVPQGWLRWPASALVQALYLAFRMLTGLRVTRLPDYGAALRQAGMERVTGKHLLGGVLVTELWVAR